MHDVHFSLADAMHIMHNAGMSKLRQYRISKKMTQRELAQQIGIHQASLSRIEAGETLPDWGTAAIIAKVTGGIVPLETWIAEGAAQ